MSCEPTGVSFPVGSRLRSLVNATGRLLGSPFDLVRRSAAPRQAFIKYLRATAEIIRATEDLLECAYAARIQSHGVDDLISRYLATHIQEERHHYAWLLEDISHAANDVGDAPSEVNVSTLRAIPGLAYYSVRLETPLALFGYMASLEGRPSSETTLNEFQKELGLPAASLRTLRLHSTEDVHHSDELFSVLNECAIQSHEWEIIKRLAIETETLYAEAMYQVLAET